MFRRSFNCFRLYPRSNSVRDRYSKDIVYNNFPWPILTKAQRTKIAQTAKTILDTRALYPEESLAALYNPLTMPTALRKAHDANDRAVTQVYGFNRKEMTEADIVAEIGSYEDRQIIASIAPYAKSL